MKYIGTYSDPQDIATKANVDAVADDVAEIKADYAQTASGNTLGAHKIVNTDANGKLIGTDGVENAVVKYSPTNGLETSAHMLSSDKQTIITYIDEENNTGFKSIFTQESIKIQDANNEPCFLLNEQILALTGNQGTLIGIPDNIIQITGGRISIGETGEEETSNVTIKNVVTPTDDSDAVPKSYVDALTASDVGALPSDTTYVSSVDGESGAVTTSAVKTTAQTLTDAQKTQARTNIGAGTSSFSGSYNDLSDKPTIPANTSDLTNDSGFITSAQAPVQSVNSKTGAVTLSASDVEAVPTTRTVNGKALSANINLTADDVGALPDTTVIPAIPDNLVQYTAIGAVQDVDALNADTLEGHNAAYFATSAGLTTTNNKVTTNTNNITTLTTGLSTANGNISSLQTGKVDKSGSTMTGALVAQNNTNYTTKQVRNIIISTADPSGGASGDIWIKYQA